jgi:hypothetical protein
LLGVLSELVTYKGTSKQTGGAYSLFEVAGQEQATTSHPTPRG